MVLEFTFIRGFADWIPDGSTRWNQLSDKLCVWEPYFYSMQTTISLASDNEDILLVKLAGKISLKTLYDFLIAFHELNTLPAHLRLLYDLQEAQIDLTKEDRNNFV